MSREPDDKGMGFREAVQATLDALRAEVKEDNADKDKEKQSE